MSKTNLTLLLIACFKLAFTQVEKDKIPYSNADQLKGTFQIEVSSEKTPAISVDRKSTRLNSSHIPLSRMPSSA